MAGAPMHDTNRSYLSISELENKVHAAFNAYDQYEVAVPLRQAGQCMEALAQEMYGPGAHWRGFRSPLLLRFSKGKHTWI
jgi:hypothetical protein